MSELKPYDRVIEKTFFVDHPTVADLKRWLDSIPPDAKIPPHVLIRYNYDLEELTIRSFEDDAL